MSRVDVGRMRKQLERNSEAAERDERHRWLAGLTPEHRALHEGLYGAFCSTCATERAGLAGRAIDAAMARIVKAQRAAQAVPVGDRGQQT